MIDLARGLANEYLENCREQLAEVETDLLAIEKRGADIDEERIHSVLRAIHSIKGGAGFFGLVKIAELAHRAEDVLSLMGSRELVPTPDAVHTLLRTADRLCELVEDPRDDRQQDIAGILAELDSLRGQGQGPHRLRTLLVEDDFTSRLFLQTFLSRYGDCHIAVNGREAVEAFRSALERGQGYDLICMDIMMPEMDGHAAVQQVRAIEEGHGVLSTWGVKIIMTTALDGVKDVSQSYMELCDAYLVKPIDLSKLLRHMRCFQLVP